MQCVSSSHWIVQVKPSTHSVVRVGHKSPLELFLEATFGHPCGSPIIDIGFPFIRDIQGFIVDTTMYSWTVAGPVTCYIANQRGNFVNDRCVIIAFLWIVYIIGGTKIRLIDVIISTKISPSRRSER